MTQLRHQLADGLPLNADMPQPPFPVWLSLPAAWSLLDIDPGTWRRSANELLDTTFRGSRLPAADRRTFLGFIEGLVADCQAAGACVSLIMVGRRAGGGAASAGIHLAFGDTGVPASLGVVQDSVPRGGTRTEVDGGVGPALLQRERMTMLIPGTADLAALTSIQIFVPIPGTTWTAVLATASAHPELTGRLETLLVQIARSIRVDPPDGARAVAGAGDGGARDDDSSAGGRAARDATRRAGPLITDGFGDLRRRRIGGPERDATGGPERDAAGATESGATRGPHGCTESGTDG